MHSIRSKCVCSQCLTYAYTDQKNFWRCAPMKCNLFSLFTFYLVFLSFSVCFPFCFDVSCRLRIFQMPELTESAVAAPSPEMASIMENLQKQTLAASTSRQNIINQSSSSSMTETSSSQQVNANLHFYPPFEISSGKRDSNSHDQQSDKLVRQSCQCIYFIRVSQHMHTTTRQSNLSAKKTKYRRKRDYFTTNQIFKFPRLNATESTTSTTSTTALMLSTISVKLCTVFAVDTITIVCASLGIYCKAKSRKKSHDFKITFRVFCLFSFEISFLRNRQLKKRVQFKSNQLNFPVNFEQLNFFWLLAFCCFLSTFPGFHSTWNWKQTNRHHHRSRLSQRYLIFRIAFVQNFLSYFRFWFVREHSKYGYL